jgi:RNA polymerase sigma-70 factor (ECF subfamily)
MVRNGGGRELVSWEEYKAEDKYAREPADTLTPEKIFEKRWATTLLEQVLVRLRAEFQNAGRLDLFEQLKPHLWEEDDTTPYAELATRFQLSVSAIKVTTHRLRVIATCAPRSCKR